MYIQLMRLSLRQFSLVNIRKFSQAKAASLEELPAYIEVADSFKNHDEKVINSLLTSMTIHKDFLSEDEEQSLLDEVEPYLKNLRYEFDHWDDAIHGYRETERLKWNTENTKILNRVRNIAFPPEVSQIKYVHVLDLDEKGVIKPHVDAIKFCGNTIAGLSLLTNSVMRLVHEKEKDLFAKVLLPRRSLYIMKDSARYDYTHEILKNDESFFKNNSVIKKRRISIICRNEPVKEQKEVS